ncbi:Putative secreted protein [Xanthomonas campestris pv. campestris]|uniref:Secreted protein n=3 Tax=Xanthomonas campestris TaxID=339 RepID=B0RW99_XANCB|nr:Putative secreted protein [Xanthomonas campestris pv. campestris]
MATALPGRGHMRKTFKTLIVALPLAAASLLAQAADSPVGRWKTIDDETGKPKSVVQIEQAANGTLSGKVVEILQSNHGPNPTCDKCDGALKGKPIKGMTILWGLKPDGTAVWGGGSVLDPAKGKTYKAKITLTEGGKKLQMRGYVGIEALGRTQTWVRE